MLQCHGCGRNDGDLHVCNRCQRAVYCSAKCSLGVKCIGARAVHIQPGQSDDVPGNLDPIDQMNTFLGNIERNPGGPDATQFFTSLTLTYGVTHYKLEKSGVGVRADIDRETRIAFPQEEDAEARLQQLRGIVSRGQQAEQPPNYESMLDLLTAFDSIERIKSVIEERYKNMNLIWFYQTQIQRDLNPNLEVGDVVDIEVDARALRLAWLANMKRAYDNLMVLVGLKEAKRDIIRLIQSHMIRPFDTLSSHRGIIAWGNPGTGKTEFSKRMAKLFYYFGLSIEDSASVKTKSDFTGTYLGGTASKTSRLIYKSLGSVIFFDEAYSLTDDQYGYIALNTIVSLLSTYQGLVLMMLAGYEDDIKARLFAVNPGLKSRFPNRILFADFTAPELWKITLQMLEDRNTGLKNPAVAESIQSAFALLVRLKAFKDDNARAVANFVDDAINIQRGLLPFELGRQQRINPLILTDQATVLALQKLTNKLKPGTSLRFRPSEKNPGLEGFEMRPPTVRPYTLDNHPKAYLHIPTATQNAEGRQREEADNDADYQPPDRGQAVVVLEPRQRPTRQRRRIQRTNISSF